MRAIQPQQTRVDKSPPSVNNEALGSAAHPQKKTKPIAKKPKATEEQAMDEQSAEALAAEALAEEWPVQATEATLLGQHAGAEDLLLAQADTAVVSDAGGGAASASSTTATTSAVTSAAWGTGLSNTAWLWGGLGLVGVAAAAGGSGSRAASTSTSDTTAPTFTEGATVGVDFSENGTGTVHTAEATDNVGVNAYAFADGGADNDKFDLDTTTGELTFKEAPDFETPGSAAGSNTYIVKVKATDAASNSTGQTVTVNVTDIDEVAPVFNSTASASVAENTASSIVLYTAAATDDTAVSYSFAKADATGGSDNHKFTLDNITGELRFIASPDFEIPSSAANTNAYSVKINATDAAGNVRSKDVTITVTDVVDAGQAVIDLGEYGKLIAPVHVDGKWYYAWDMNGDGVNNDAQDTTGKLSANGSVVNATGTGYQYDYTTHDVLDGLFNKNINGVTNTTVLNADGKYGTTNDYRYTTLAGVKLALPTIGDGFNYVSTTTLYPGTAINNDPVGETNPTYDDLLAIWDAHNGIGTDSNISGTPVGWVQNNVYWSATPSTSGHAYLDFESGNVNSYVDGGATYVAVQVLDFSYTTAQAFAFWQEAADAHAGDPSKDINALNQHSAQIVSQRDTTNPDGSANQADPAKRLAEYVDQVTGTDIVSDAEFDAGFTLTGKAAAGQQANIKFWLDKDRTDGTNEVGVQLQHGQDGVSIAYDNATGEYSISFAAGSTALQQATHNTYGSGVHQITVDTDGSGAKNGSEASRLFLVASGTALTTDTGLVSQNYSVQDRVSGDLFVYYYGDPDGDGVGAWTELDNGDSMLNQDLVLTDRDGDAPGFGDHDYYASNLPSGTGSTAANTAMHFVTDIKAQVWEFHMARYPDHVATNVTNWNPANEAAVNHELWGSNTSRLPSLAEVVALYAANFGGDSAGGNTPEARTVGAIQPMSDAGSTNDYVANEHNQPAMDWDNSLWSAGVSPTGHLLVDLYHGNVLDMSANLPQVPYIVAAVL